MVGELFKKQVFFPGNAFKSVSLKLTTCKQDVWREYLDFITAATNPACSFRCKELFDCDQNLKVTNEKINQVTTIPL